ncbi:MAG: ester cyclase [Bacteroidota bacterium]
MNNETILREFMQKVWNEKDFDAIPQFVDDTYTIYLDTGDLWEGKTLDHQEFKTRLNFSFNSFPDIHFSIQTAIADGNYVAITWIMTGTNLGNIGDFPPTGKSIKTNGSTIYHFKNGKICGHSQVFDRTIVMKQLGFTQ